jgi:hypothetical protein
MKERRFKSVWEAIESSPAEAANMKARSDVMFAIREVVDKWKVTQAEAAKRLGSPSRGSMTSSVGGSTSSAWTPHESRGPSRPFGSCKGRSACCLSHPVFLRLVLALSASDQLRGLRRIASGSWRNGRRLYDEQTASGQSGKGKSPATLEIAWSTAETLAVDVSRLNQAVQALCTAQEFRSVCQGQG